MPGSVGTRFLRLDLALGAAAARTMIAAVYRRRRARTMPRAWRADGNAAPDGRARAARGTVATRPGAWHARRVAPHPRVRFHVPDLGEEEIAAAAACLASGEIGGDGPLGRRAEARLRELTGARHALLVTSATHALELALMALDVRPGDEVVCPSFTFPSTANCILQRGARPVFADVRADTLEIDAQDVARVVGPATRAVLPVDYGGVGCDIAALRAAVADAARAAGARNDIAIVEDAAQGIGARRSGAHLGTTADAGAISFHATKNLSCGEGGVLLLRDDTLFRRAEIGREKGTNRHAFERREVDHYEWVAQGSSFVLSDLLAAVLLAQLDKLEHLTAVRRAVAARYDQGFAGLYADGALRPQTVPAGCESNGHVYAIRTADRASQRALRERLAAAGIEAPFHFVPLHTTGFARRTFGEPRSLPVTDDCWATLLRLPIHPSLTREQQDRVITEVRAAF
jgi:dTDP-4-amino-4,6-dideoxygalactose transaminase